MENLVDKKLHLFGILCLDVLVYPGCSSSEHPTHSSRNDDNREGARVQIKVIWTNFDTALVST